MKALDYAKKYVTVPIALGAVAATSFPAFAADAGVVSATDWSAVITAMTAQISVSTVIGALTTFMAASIGLVFMWWGLRKAVRTLMAAMRKGKISV